MATRYVYLAGGREVTHDDPNDEYKPDEIRQHWAQTFPELANATWEQKEENGVKVVTFAKKVGTKGDAGPTWPAWISVDERLPEDLDLVLVVSPDFDQPTVGNWMKPEEGDDQSGWAVFSPDEYQLVDCPVTHWSALPPAPEAR